MPRVITHDGATIITSGLPGFAFLMPQENREQKRDYFDEYAEKEPTEIGQKIVAERNGMVDLFLDKDALVLDVGIGAGGFVSSRENCVGYDVDPKAKDWLEAQGKWFDPDESTMDDIKGFTFWDSFEHIPHFETWLRRIMPGSYLFLSIPIWPSGGFPDDIPRSKHFKPDEHVNYFTDAGLSRATERIMTATAANKLPPRQMTPR